MSIEKEIQKILESRKVQVSEEIVETIEDLDEEAVKPESGTVQPDVAKANGDQTVVQKGVTTGVDNEKPSDNDQSKEKPTASGSKSKNVEFGDNPKPTGGHDQSKDRMESVDVSADVEALIDGEDLTEEFKAKAATIFEAAVVTKIKEQLTKIEESYEARLDEEVEVIKQGLVEKVDGYLDYMVEQWLQDNEIALTHGIKVEMMENFMSGMKNLFTENFVEIPEEKFDVLESMEARLTELETKLDESENKNVELNSELNEMKRSSLVAQATEGLTEAQKEKFQELVNELKFESEDTFTSKLNTIRESYITKTKTKLVETVVTNEPVIEEEIQRKPQLSESMSMYVNNLNKSKR